MVNWGNSNHVLAISHLVSLFCCIVHTNCVGGCDMTSKTLSYTLNNHDHKYDDVVYSKLMCGQIETTTDYINLLIMRLISNVATHELIVYNIT